MRDFLEQAADQTLRSQYSISLTGLLEASVTVLITTLEDCVWLIPFVARAPTTGIALAHATIFVATFVGCAVATSLLAVAFDSLVGAGSGLVLEGIGAILCWSLAGYFFYVSCRKSRQRRQRQQQNQEHPGVSQEVVQETESLVEAAEDNASSASSESEYGTARGEDPENIGIDFGGDHGGAADRADGPVEASMQPWVIVSLTILGSLDEVSYFPALIVGQIFTTAELIAATLIASLLILLLVDILKQRCGIVLSILDQIPLYAIIAAFAVLLTVEALFDLIDE